MDVASSVQSIFPHSHDQAPLDRAVILYPLFMSTDDPASRKGGDFVVSDASSLPLVSVAQLTTLRYPSLMVAIDSCEKGASISLYVTRSST